EAEDEIAEQTSEHARPAPSGLEPEIIESSPPVKPDNIPPSPELGPLADLGPIVPTFVGLETSADLSSAPLFADFQFAPSVSSLTTGPLDAPQSIPTGSTAAQTTDALELIPTQAPGAPIVLVAWWLQPLALVNRVYDGSTSWLGPIGRVLRSSRMRNFLGICGLAAALGAAAWMVWEGPDWNS
ncbi:MAG TPA: hypothetical protein VGP68_00720, partial [Gemmataceae bacterium]|nr:hypothetical protein [Gemmataceae bacterium]